MELPLPAVETEITVAKMLQDGDRVLYLVSRVSLLRTEGGRIAAGWLTPLAVLIMEPDSQQALSMAGERMSLDEVLELAPSLREVIDPAQGIRRVRVT